MKIKGGTHQDIRDKIITFPGSAGLNDKQMRLIQMLQAHAGQLRLDMGNAVFESLFRSKYHVWSLYRCLAPDDGAATEQDISLENPPVGSIRGFVNTLRFWVRDELQLVLEARAPLTPRMECDVISFVASFWDSNLVSNNRFASVTHPTQIPITKIYVLFPLSAEPDQDNGIRTFGDVNGSSLTCKAKCVYHPAAGSFLAQYMRSMKICDDAMRQCADNNSALTMIRERCAQENLIPKYFAELSPEILLGFEPAP